jgi:mono/diheme cytochrome c family protein
VRRARCGLRRAVPGAWCGVLGAVLGAWYGVLGAEGGVRGAVVGMPATTPVEQAAAPRSAALPDGEGVQVLRSRCLSCHGTDLITSQRLTQAGWGREIDKMVRWGAAVTDEERAPLQSYLARHFAPASPATPVDAATGEAIFSRACLACHGADLTEQQRLSPAGWTREVEKMMRWGAQVSEAEKVALVDYLASRYPVR